VEGNFGDEGHTFPHGSKPRASSFQDGASFPLLHGNESLPLDNLQRSPKRGTADLEATAELPLAGQSVFPDATVHSLPQGINRLLGQGLPLGCLHERRWEFYARSGARGKERASPQRGSAMGDHVVKQCNQFYSPCADEGKGGDSLSCPIVATFLKLGLDNVKPFPDSALNK